METLRILLKILLLTAVMFVLFIASSLLFGVGEAAEAMAGGEVEVQPTDPAEQAALALPLLGVCLLQTAVLSLTILRSRWSGWRLAVVVFALSFGMMSILSHMESLVYLRDLSRSMIGRLILANALLTAVFSPVAVWTLGRSRHGHPAARPRPRVPRTAVGWAAAIAALALLHLVLYYVFGYYVAWQSPELREFYGGEDPGSLVLQLQSIARGTPWMIPFQLSRGVLWALLAVPLALMLVGSRLSAALVAAALFGILVPASLLLPNPFMPDTVRLLHFVETLLSRSLFGFLAIWLLRRT